MSIVLKSRSFSIISISIGGCYMDNIGAKLKEIRLRKKLTQKNLAAKAGISNSYLSDIESGRTKPSLKTLEELTHSLGIKFEDLIVSSVSLEEKRSIEEQLNQDKIKFNLLNSVFHKIKQGILITNSEGKIIDANDRFSKFVGIPIEQLVSKKATMFIRPNSLWKIRDLVKSNKHSEIYILEELIDSHTRIVEKYIVNIQKQRFNDDLIFIAILDPYNSAKEILPLLNTRPPSWYNHLLDHSPNAVVILDLKFNVIEVNINATNFFEMLRVDLIGLDFRSFCKKTNLSSSYIDNFHKLKKGVCFSDVMSKKINSKVKKAAITGYPILIEGKLEGFCITYAQVNS